MNSTHKNFRDLFVESFSEVKRQHGSGQYSYAEGMNRRSARKIARKRARRALRELRAFVRKQDGGAK